MGQARELINLPALLMLVVTFCLGMMALGGGVWIFACWWNCVD